MVKFVSHLKEKINPTHKKEEKKLKCAVCGKELPSEQLGATMYLLKEGGPRICRNCYEKKHPSPKTLYIDEIRSVVHVKLAHPVMTGFWIALGFVIFNLVVLLIIFLFFGASIGRILSSIF